MKLVLTAILALFIADAIESSPVEPPSMLADLKKECKNLALDSKVEVASKKCPHWKVDQGSSYEDIRCALYYTAYSTYCKFSGVAMNETVSSGIEEICAQNGLIPAQIPKDHDLNQILHARHSDTCRDLCLEFEEVNPWCEEIHKLAYYANKAPVVKVVPARQPIAAQDAHKSVENEEKKAPQAKIEAQKSPAVQPENNAPSKTVANENKAVVLSQDNVPNPSSKEAKAASEPKQSNSDTIAKPDVKPNHDVKPNTDVKPAQVDDNIKKPPAIADPEPETKPAVGETPVQEVHITPGKKTNKVEPKAVETVESHPVETDNVQEAQQETVAEQTNQNVNPAVVETNQNAPPLGNAGVKEKNPVDEVKQDDIEANNNFEDYNPQIDSDNGDVDSVVKPKAEDVNDKAETSNKQGQPKKPSNVEETEPVNENTNLEGDSYFFTYFMIFSMVFIVGYITYHNKQKLLALALEGRRGKRHQYRSRRPNSSNYQKLDSNLEEAMSSSCSKNNTSHVIY